jgi:NAD(P)-dependent dehydrogenase (short-subunit alcohol dehydrogenase family)
MRQPGDGQGVVVTGASSGIGRATALHLDRLGFTVFAGIRTEDDAESLARQASPRLHPLHLDVTREEEIEAARRTVEETDLAGGLVGLVNNAGVVIAGPLEILPLDLFRRQLEVNTVGSLAVTQAFLPALRAAGGRVVNVSSVNGRVASPWTGAYAASKFALEALSDALRRELSRWRIEVVVVEPGAVETAIWSSSLARSRRNMERIGERGRELYGRLIDKLVARAGKVPPHAIPAERVAARVVHALTARRPRTRYLVGADARLGALLTWLPDRLQDRILLR